MTDHASRLQKRGTVAALVIGVLLLSGCASETAGASTPASMEAATGIGIGSTQEELTAAYPSITRVEGLYAPYCALPDDRGNWINFTVTEDGLVDTVVVRASPQIDSEYCG